MRIIGATIVSILLSASLGFSDTVGMSDDRHVAASVCGSATPASPFASMNVVIPACGTGILQAGHAEQQSNFTGTTDNITGFSGFIQGSTFGMESGGGLSYFDVTFQIFEAQNYTSHLTWTTTTNLRANVFASFSFDGVMLSIPEAPWNQTQTLNTSGVLQPGTYHVNYRVRAEQTFHSSSAFGDGRADFTFAMTPVAQQSNIASIEVPEPTTLGLMLLGGIYALTALRKSAIA